ncbi:MAG: hypothetical protein VYE26_07225 [Pseudomonadota bacterium]|nr:hypothetical protein [Pseudomonadota bacterium]
MKIDANPNATNSELDAKQIVHNVTFDDYKFADEIDDPLDTVTEQMKEELIEQFVELVVDGMDMKTLVSYARDQLSAYYYEGSIEELKLEIDNYDDELWDELVDNCEEKCETWEELREANS